MIDFVKIWKNYKLTTIFVIQNETEEVLICTKKK
jgi:hypothetical protein